MLRIRRLSWLRQVLGLGALSALLTLCAGGAAVLALSHSVQVAHQLGELIRVQRYHQDADMAHDALRGDVAEAQRLGGEGSPAARAQLLALAESHAAQMRRDLKNLRTIEVSPEVRPALNSLDTSREAYVVLALERVRAELQGTHDAKAQARFEKTFDDLVKGQADVTTRLAEISTRVETDQANDERSLSLIVALASAGILVGWVFLLATLRRAARRLFRALSREAEQRAVADQLRRTLLPERLPVIPGLRLAARSKPVNSTVRVGGDWYDVIALPSGEVGLVVGDVVGHDLEAATAMGQMRAALRVIAVDEPSPAAVLTRVNRVADLLQVTDLTTCVYAVVNPSTRTVCWSSAGHLNPLAVRAAGSTRLLSGDPGPPIGVADDAVYVDRICLLEPRDSLMLYTDGLVERRSASISDNLTRLEQMSGPNADPETLCDYVLELMLVEEPEVGDDVTVLVLQAV